MDINWNDPEERLNLLERVGGPEYNRLMEQYKERSVVEVVNGHKLRWTLSSFGTLCMVGDTGKAFRTIEAARAFALKTAR